jgi:hypothetical protein
LYRPKLNAIEQAKGVLFGTEDCPFLRVLLAVLP